MRIRTFPAKTRLFCKGDKTMTLGSITVKIRKAAAGLLVCSAIFLTTDPSFAVVNDSGILNNQGVELYERQNYHSAIKAFEHAAQIDPMNPKIYANLGYSYMAINNYDRAIGYFKQSLSIDPKDLDVHNNLGVCFYNQGLRDRAVAEWEFILTQDPTNVAAAGNLGMVRHPEVADQIIVETRDALLSPVEREVLVSRGLKGLFDSGKEYYQRERYDDAIMTLTRVVDAMPGSKYSHYYLGLSYAYLHRVVPAMRHLREYLVLESYPPENQKAYNDAKRIFKTLQEGEMVEARATSSSSQAAVIFQQGKDAYRRGDYFRAVNIMNKVYNYKPTSFPANYYLGMSYRELGDRERAVFHLSKCLLAGPEERSTEKAREISMVIKQLTR